MNCTCLSLCQLCILHRTVRAVLSLDEDGSEPRAPDAREALQLVLAQAQGAVVVH